MVKENIYICKHDVENKKRLRVEVKDKGIQEWKCCAECIEIFSDFMTVKIIKFYN